MGFFSFIDNKPFIDNLRSTKSVTKKRLRIDLASIKQIVEKKEVVKVQWINHKLQLADVFTKKGVNSETLRGVLETGILPNGYFHLLHDG